MNAMKSFLTIAGLVLMFSTGYAENQFAVSMQEIAKSHIELGLNYAKVGDYLTATAEFEEALKYDPETQYNRAEVSNFYYELGMVYIYSADGKGSLKFFNRALFLNPDNSSAKNGMALAYVVEADAANENGDQAAAKEYLAQALEINPGLDMDNVLSGMAENFVVIANVDQPNSDFAVTYSMIAKEYYKEGSYQQAKEYYEMALQLVPEYEKAQKGLELTAARLGMGTEQMANVN